MDSSELIELFYNRAYEKFVNKQILDDKNYIVPRQQLINYIRELINVPFIYFIDYIRQNAVDRRVELPDTTQFSSFPACEIEMCNALIWANNPGCQYVDIGRFFPDNIISKSDSSYRRYGESHIKAASQLGLAFEYYDHWYLSCLGYVYPDLDKEIRKQLLARTITRNRLYQQMLVDILDHDIKPEVYLDLLAESVKKRRLRNICAFFDICLEECKRENIKTHSLIRSYETSKPQFLFKLPPEINKNLRAYLNEFDYRTLSYETTLELIKKYQKGDSQAYNVLIKGHMRLVLTIAKKYSNYGVDFDDLIQEGFIGLVKALEHFNTNHNIEFGKYASWWIMQSITQALANLPYLVQVPLNVITMHRKVWRFIDNFFKEHGRFPSVCDFDAKSDLNELSSSELIYYTCHLPPNLREMVCFVDEVDGFESGSSPTDDYMDIVSKKCIVDDLLSCLKDRNRLVLEKYFGIGTTQDGETLISIGIDLGLTRERVRQIVEENLSQLRNKPSVRRKAEMLVDIIES